MTSEPQYGSGQRYWLTLIPLAFAAIIRLAAAWGDLAIDEIWSLWFAQNVIKSVFHVFALRHDNNHILNTIVMFGLGPGSPGICYRIVPVLASILSVWLAGRILFRRGGFPAIVAAWILVGASYLLILYGSEARGYSYVVCFAYLSWLFLQRTEAYGRWSDATVFAVCASLGFLGHLTFLYCYAGFCIWTFLKFMEKRSWILVFAHILPSATALFLYLFFIRGITIGGGPEADIVAVIITTLSLIAGGPLHGDGSLVMASLVLIMIAASFIRICQADWRLALSYLTTILIAPAAVLMLSPHVEVYPRYFLVSVAFALLMIGDAMSGWWNASRGHRIAIVVVAGVYVFGNCWWTALLLDHGRGGYSQALTWMATQVKERPESLSTDHDFRNRIVFDYYASRLWPKGSPITYVEQRMRPLQGTDWLILHSFEDQPPYPNDLVDPQGNIYKLQRTFWHRSLTGWTWSIYRRTKNDRD